MSARLIQAAGVGAGIVLFVAAMVWPAIALGLRAAQAGMPAVPYHFPPGLFLRTTLLAAGGALAALVFSLPGAFVAARVGRRRRDGLLLALIIAPLLFPAMVYAFGWDRVLKVPGELRCIWVWATWSWPVPALILGAGWRRLGRGRYEAALLSARPPRAFVHGVFPILWRHVLVAWLVLFAFYLGDYTAPHGCGLLVYATELLLAAESAHNPRAALVESLPVAALILVALLVALLVWRNRPLVDTSDDPGSAGRGGAAPWVAAALATLCVAVPIAGLLRTVPLVASVRETLATYGGEIGASVGVAAAGGIATMLMGAALAALPRMRGVALAWALVWAALPGALIGSAVVAAYLPVPLVYDHWGIMAIGYVARFGWIGIAIGVLAQAGVGRAQRDAARADGAGAVTVAWRVALAGNLPTLGVGALVIAALCLSEAATTALVRVPAVYPLSLILIESFHRFEDTIMAGMSVLLVGAALPGALLVIVAARRE